MPYRASLSGIFGSGVQAPPPRQPLVDVGSVIDAVTGGINAQTQRMTLRHSIAQQDAAQQLATQRQSAYEAHQQAMERMAAETERTRAEKEKTDSQVGLAKAMSEGFVPEQPVNLGGFSGLPGGLDAVSGAGTVTAPAHFDPTQSLAYRVAQARGVAADEHIDRRGALQAGLVRTRAALAAQNGGGATGGSSGGAGRVDTTERDHRNFLLRRGGELMKPTKKPGEYLSRPGLSATDAQAQAEQEWQAAHATASGGGTAAAHPSHFTPETETAIAATVQRIRNRQATLDNLVGVPPEIVNEIKARLGASAPAAPAGGH